jgi:phenylacetate-coenzyme A ligase PaaK-like adenylate-forming protein
VAADFVAKLGMHAEVTAVAQGTLPRFEMKARRFIVE